MDIDQAKIDLSGDMAAPAQPAATNVSRSGIVDELAELRERVDHAVGRPLYISDRKFESPESAPKG